MPQPGLDLDQLRERGYCLLRAPTPALRDLAVRARERGLELMRTARGKDRNFTFADGSFKQLLDTHRTDPIFRALVGSPEVLACVRELFAERPGFVTHSKVSYKIPGHAHVWLPHQDSGYKSVQRRGGYTLSVFLEACDRRNGTLEVFPGSHQLGPLPHRWRSVEDERVPQLYLEPLPPIDPVAVDGEPGDILVFDRHMIHQSGPNTVGGTRSIFIFEVEPLVVFAIDDRGRNATVLGGDYSLARSAIGPLIRFPVQVFERARTLWHADMTPREKWRKLVNAVWRR